MVTSRYSLLGYFKVHFTGLLGGTLHEFTTRYPLLGSFNMHFRGSLEHTLIFSILCTLNWVNLRFTSQSHHQLPSTGSLQSILHRVTSSYPSLSYFKVTQSDPNLESELEIWRPFLCYNPKCSCSCVWVRLGLHLYEIYAHLMS